MIAARVRRHRLIVLAGLLMLAGAVLIMPGSIPTQPTTSIPPAQVVIQNAIFTQRGVDISWLPAQAGSHPINGYTIERSRGPAAYEAIGHTEKLSTNFIDENGRVDDRYRVTAKDSQQPALRSLVSDEIVATLPRAGQTFAVASGNDSRVLGTAYPDNDTLLRRSLAQTLEQFDQVGGAENPDAIARIVDAIQQYQHFILQSYPTFSLEQKQSFSDLCQSHATSMETAMHRIPENLYFQGHIIQANCQVMSRV